MPLEKYRDLLSVNDLIEIFGVSKTTLYREIKNGTFGKPIRIGRAYKFPKMVVIEKVILENRETCVMP